MPAVTSVSIYGAVRFSRALAAFGGRVARRLKQVIRSVRNRRDAVKLARFDDRMLADIGLTRSDLRDAYSESIWRDPTDILARRACERRGHRGPGIRGVTVAGGFCRPSADREARYLI